MIESSLISGKNRTFKPIKTTFVPLVNKLSIIHIESKIRKEVFVYNVNVYF